MSAVVDPCLIRIAGMFASRTQRGRCGGYGSLPVDCGRSASALRCDYGSWLLLGGDGCGGGDISLPVLPPPGSSSSSSSVA